MIVIAAVVEIVLKVLMLADLRRRTADEVRGSTWLWAAGALLNTGGLLPLAYFVVGRRRDRPRGGAPDPRRRDDDHHEVQGLVAKAWRRGKTCLY